MGSQPITFDPAEISPVEEKQLSLSFDPDEVTPVTTKPKFTGQELGTPGPAKPRLPAELESPEQAQARRQQSGAVTSLNTRTGKTYTGEGEAPGPFSVLDAPVRGGQEMIRGVEQAAEPGLRAKARGATSVISGAMEATSPLMAGTAIAAPLHTALALGVGALSQETTEALLDSLTTEDDSGDFKDTGGRKKLVPEEYTKLAGILAGLVGAKYGADIPGLIKDAAFRANVKRILQDKLNEDYRARTAAEKADAANAAAPKQLAAGEEPPPDNIQEGQFEDVGGAPRRALAAPQTFSPEEIQPVEPTPPVAPQAGVEPPPSVQAGQAASPESSIQQASPPAGPGIATLAEPLPETPAPAPPVEETPAKSAAPASESEVVQPKSSAVESEAGAPNVEKHQYRNKSNDKVDVYVAEHPGKGWQADGDFNLQGHAGGHLGTSGYDTFYHTKEQALDAFLESATRPQNTLTAKIGSLANGKLLQRQQDMIDWVKSLKPEEAPAPEQSVAEKPQEPVKTGDTDVKVTKGNGKETLGLVPLEVRRPGLDDMLDIKRQPTGWKQIALPDGVALVHPSEDQAIRFEANDKRSGTAVTAARAQAQTYAMDNPIEVQKPTATSSKDAFRMGGKQLEKLAKDGDTGAQTELDRRATKNGKPVSKPAEVAKTTSDSGDTGDKAPRELSQKIVELPDTKSHTPLIDIPGTEAMIKESAEHLQISPDIVGLMTPHEVQEELAETYPEILGKKDNVESIEKTKKPVTPQIEGLGGSKYVLPKFASAGAEKLPAKTEAEKPEHEFSSSQVNLPTSLHKSFNDAAAGIPDSELAADGREDKPHITLKYGLHADEPSALKKLLRDEGPIKATVGKVSLFKGQDADVVKLDVDSPDLHRLNEKVAGGMEHTDTHPDYTPHMTLAYVKPGEGDKYVGKSVPGLTGKEITFPTVTFSAKDRSKTHIPLFGKKKEIEFKETEITLTKAGLVGKDVTPKEETGPTKKEYTPAEREVLNILGRKKNDVDNLPDYFGSRNEFSYEEMNKALIDLVRKGDVEHITMPTGGRGFQRVIAKKEEPVASTEEKNTIEASNGREANPGEQPVRSADHQPLAEQLPEAGGEAGEGGAIETRGAKSSRARKSRARAGVGQGSELESGGGTVSGVVGDPARPERTFPPRAQDVVSTHLDRDYRIPDGRVVSGSPEARARINIDAITALRRIQEENRPATVEEQHILAGYVGWGAVPQLFAGRPEFVELQRQLKNLLTPEEYADAQRSTTNAHYTGDLVVDSMWKALQQIGAKPGMSWLEPAIGVGNFFGRQPQELLEGARRVGLDKDSLSGQIAKLLYPDSGIDIKAFEEAELPKDYFDGAISNVPFGNFGVHDAEFRGKGYLTASIHNYFFAKALTLVRPGGVVGFVTSRYTMDAYSPGAVSFRKWLADQAHLIGAVRLPSGAFQQNAGADVITDVIFLRKKLPGEESRGVTWAEAPPKAIRGAYGTVPVPVNEYYHQHPEMILGKETTARGQFTNHDYDVDGNATPEKIAEAISKFPSDLKFEDFTPEKRARKIAIREINAPAEQSKLGGLFFDDKGQLFRKTSKGSAEPIEVSNAMSARIKGQLEIRDALTKLTGAELADRPDLELKNFRQKLNKAYDAYVKKNGPLSSRSNTAAMKGDPDAPLLVSLERRFQKGNKTEGVEPSAEKAPIFERRMLRPPKVPDSVGDPKESLYISLNEKGRIDFDRMSELTGRTPEQLQKDLAGLVYQDPQTKIWQTAEEYLSGSVRKKLKQAEAIAKIEPQYAANVEALKNAQPVDVPPGEIRALLGVTWVPIDRYTEFATDMLGADKPVKVRYAGGNWVVDAGWGNHFSNAQKFSTSRVPAIQILEDSLNMRRTKVTNRDSDGSVTVDTDETKAARARQMEMQDHFEKWLFAEPKRGDELVRIYNDTQNDLRLRTYDGAHLTLPGMTKDAAVVRGGDLDPHQKAAVWRGIVQPNVLLAHAVGTGKTFEAIAIGMELKRLGLVQRPMYVVPNATLTSWQDQFAALYPQRRVIVFGEKDLKRSKRQQVMAHIATGDWDAVVVPHSSFQFLPTGDDIFNQHFQKLSSELEGAIQEAQEAGIDTRQIKRMEKAKERLLKSLKDKRGEEKKDQTVTWEQLGIDQLFVDESHEYKKLGFSTKQGNVAGIDQGGNQKTFDLLMKLRYTQSHGRGAVFMTGTPITNTMGELYSIMKYLIEPELEARGIGKFDEWAANFGRTVDVFEPKVEGGGYQMKARFAQFVNLPELAQLFRSFADVVTSDMVDIPRPAIAGGKRAPIEQQLSTEQEDYLEELRERAKRIRNDPRGSLPDNMLSVYGDAAKMAMDIRMVRPGAPDDPYNRLNMAADRIYDLWEASKDKKGTQLVMSDLGKPVAAGGSKDFSAYDELINKLVERGIPKNEIAHIYQAKDKSQRTKLFQDVNDGKVRVVLGSTQKMGVGTNVQQRLYALHHLDVPHRPSDLEQREGRILRQGNENPEVHLHYYVTKGSLDEAKFSNVIRKAKFINQVMQGKSEVREAEDVGGMVPSLEMFQAMASGDPRVMQKMEVDAEVDRLSSVYSGWKNQQYKIRNDIQQIPGRVQRSKNLIEAVKRDQTIADKTGNKWSVGKQKFEGEKIFKPAAEDVPNGTAYGSASHATKGEKISKPVSDALRKEIFKVGESKAEDVPIGTAYGLPVTASHVTGDMIRLDIGDTARVLLTKDESVSADLYRRISNQIDDLPTKISQQESFIERDLKEKKNLENSVQEYWPYAEKFAEQVEKQKQLIKDLGADKGDEAALGVGEGGEIADKSVEAAEPEETDEGEEDDEDEDDEKQLKTGERGSAPMIADLSQWVAEKFKDEGPEVNYSGLGAFKTRAVRNLSQIEEASPKIHEAAVRAASSRGQAATILRAAVPSITEALKGSEVTWPEMRLALIESRLQGLAARWSNFSRQIENMDPHDLEKVYDEQFSSLLGAIEGKRDIPQDVSQTAAALVEKKDWKVLQQFLAQTFADASKQVATVMDPEWFKDVREDPHVQDALKVYKNLVEKPMAENHALNEGVFSDALGPMDTYYPLVSLDRSQPSGPGRRLAYHKPKNMANAFATGLSSGYNATMEAFRDRLGAAVRSNDKAALIRAMEKSGWLRLEGGAYDPEVFKGPDGHEYKPERVETSQGRMMFKDGRVVHIKPQMSVMPSFMARELRPILERDAPITKTFVDKILNTLNSVALAGPADAVFHANNLLGTLIANTPFLADTPAWKAASLPLAKRFGAMIKIATTDPGTEEAAADLIEMAKVGVIPDRFGSVEYSKNAAEELGAEVQKFGFGPLLFGRKGIDIRARLVMWRLAKEIDPNATPADLYKFVNQLGNYVPALQGEIERSLKRTGLSPFYTAGSTMLRNGLNAWTGQSPIPGGATISNTVWRLTAGALGTLALWVAAYKAMTGKYPWDDKKAKLLQIPVPSQYRHTKVGDMLWGKTGDTGYINFGFFNPLVMRGARAMGIPGAFETRQLRGSVGQQIEAAQTDMMNAFAQPALGPVPKAAFAGAFGKEPYILGLRDRYGSLEPQFFSAIPKKTKPPAIAARAGAALGQLNSFYSKVGVATGILPEGREDKGNQWLRMITDMTMPGLIGSPGNPGKADILKQQRSGTR